MEQASQGLGETINLSPQTPVNEWNVDLLLMDDL